MTLHRSSPRLALALLPMLMLVVLPGCVQQQYDDLLTSYRAQEQQLLNLQSELESCRANENSLRSQLSATVEDLRALEGMRMSQTTDMASLLEDYEALRRRVESMQVGPLPIELETALSQLAAQYPQEVTFDPKRGMLRFSSDFSFDLGEASLKPNAARSIGTLASILNSPSASNFEVRVVGHTDNVPIRRAETLRKHPTNVHLSAHRAISVRDALRQANVPGERIEVAGFGEYRPIVANGARGAAENRRVEVFITPLTMTVETLPASAGSGAPASGGGAVRPVDDEPMK